MTHYNLFHMPIPIPKAMKIPVAKPAVDNAWRKLHKVSVSKDAEVKRIEMK